MLTLKIAAIGRERETPMAELTASYLDRAKAMGPHIGFDGPTLSVGDAPKALTGPKRQQKETDILTDLAADGGEVVILDETGKDMSSAKFATWLAARRDAGVPAVSFLIGGADGHHPTLASAVAPRPVHKIAFGKATWPHQLVRVMIAEQLYRSCCILAGHPYHRA